MKKISQRPLRVLVTGGPTRAYLDNVRFFSNISTGALAYRLCETLSDAGVEVALVAGPTCQPFASLKLVHFVPIETTEEMHAGVLRLARTFRPDYAIFAAAVLDFTPKRKLEGKVSSSKKSWKLELKPTPKIIDEVGKRFPSIRRVGFKLEPKKEGAKARVLRARRIIDDKGLDALCLNYLSEITSQSHPAYLFGSPGVQATASSKAEISDWLASWVLRDVD